MEVTGISIENQSPRHNRPRGDLVGSKEAETPLGILLWELENEQVWSNACKVYGDLCATKPKLVITHASFPLFCPLEICDDGTIPLTLRGVEDAIRAHVAFMQDGYRLSISELQGRVDTLEEMTAQILVDKAKEAIVLAYPETSSIELDYTGHNQDLYPFALDRLSRPVYVTRAVKHEFVGVARIEVNSFQWYQVTQGIGNAQRHGIFFGELALTYVARELKIPYQNLKVSTITATENPFGHEERYTVASATISRVGARDEYHVTFDERNMPNGAAKVR